jgi:hypothetical protein
MPKDTLRVLAKGSAQVPNYEAQEGGRNARITHACLAIGPEFHDDDSHTTLRHAAFVKHVGKVVTVPDRAEYRRHLRDGDLYPADGETAAACGVPFDPDFGGEHDEDAKAEHHAALLEFAGTDKTVLSLIEAHLPVLKAAAPAPVPRPPPPPVDNDHVAPGAEQFSDDTIAHNRGEH